MSCIGCQNPEACNYDEDALIAGACDYDSCAGCTNPEADNYDPTATIDDGSCEIPGCTDPEANNYNAAANVDDGSCVFSGCTYETACNYDPTASVDDGSCDFISCLTLGCTYPGACNYDPTANLDDGSCLEVDCNGVCGGGAVFDECGACDGPGGIYECGCTDIPEGDCDCDGNQLDQCGVCGGDGTSCLGCTDEAACNYDDTATIDDDSCLQNDCNGECGGTAIIDGCGCVMAPGRFTNADVRTSQKATAIVTGISWTSVACAEAMARHAWGAPMRAPAITTIAPPSTTVHAWPWIAMASAAELRFLMNVGSAMGLDRSMNVAAKTSPLANVTATETWLTSWACAAVLA